MLNDNLNTPVTFQQSPLEGMETSVNIEVTHYKGILAQGERVINNKLSGPAE